MEIYMKTSEVILRLLKSEGALTARIIADKLNMTTMGVRKHLLALLDDKAIRYEDIKAKRGRPTRYWTLLPLSNKYFNDGHKDLSVQLIDSVKTVFGDEGLNSLIKHREMESYSQYSLVLNPLPVLHAKLTALAKLRSKDGYMASVTTEENNDNSISYWLMENHCPICTAATSCVNFCHSELALFQQLLSEHATVMRTEHIVAGARRCAYKIDSKE